MPGFDTPESGFLYKPVADNGGLVILLPSKYRESSVRLIGPDGNVIEEGRSSGYANGDREHFRFGQDGGNYPDGSIVEVTTADGKTMRYQVGDTSARIDPGGTGGSGGSSSSFADVFGGGGSSLSIQRPDLGGGTAAKQPENMFESPLSVLETIQSVSNIIVGSTKSFDSLLKFAPDNNVLTAEQPGGELTPIPKSDTDEVI